MKKVRKLIFLSTTLCPYTQCIQCAKTLNLVFIVLCVALCCSGRFFFFILFVFLLLCFLVPVYHCIHLVEKNEATFFFFGLWLVYCLSWLVNRYKSIGYSLDIMRQTSCLVVNPIIIVGYALLFNCTTAVRASDSMTASS